MKDVKRYVKSIRDRLSREASLYEKEFSLYEHQKDEKLNSYLTFFDEWHKKIKNEQVYNEASFLAYGRDFVSYISQIYESIPNYALFPKTQEEFQQFLNETSKNGDYDLALVGLYVSYAYDNSELQQLKIELYNPVKFLGAFTKKEWIIEEKFDTQKLRSMVGYYQEIDQTMNNINNKYYGFRMKGGRLTIKGNGGNWLGYLMLDGKIIVKGEAGIFVGCEMEGGEIIVEGNVDEYGLGYLMKGGKIIIKGDLKDGDWLEIVEMLSGEIQIKDKILRKK